MAVILSDDTLPNRTMIVSPISSWVKKDSQGNLLKDAQGNVVRKKLKTFEYGLLREKYPEFLKYDSYIKLDQLHTVTREAVPGGILGRLSDEDLFQVDLRLLSVLHLFDTVRKFAKYNMENANKP